MEGEDGQYGHNAHERNSQRKTSLSSSYIYVIELLHADDSTPARKIMRGSIFKMIALAEQVQSVDVIHFIP